MVFVIKVGGTGFDDQAAARVKVWGVIPRTPTLLVVKYEKICKPFLNQNFLKRFVPKVVVDMSRGGSPNFWRGSEPPSSRHQSPERG